MTVFDTIGVEDTNDKRNTSKIKEKIHEFFEENLEDPKKSLHGILYCIRNGSGDKKILEGEINFILELNKIYGNYDILTIVFTQTFNQNTKERIKELRKDLKNDNIEIIDIRAKDQIIKNGKKNIILEKYGIDKLINSMKKKAKKIVVANLKQITKIKIKEKYCENINIKYNEIKKKIRNHIFESSLTKECEFILENLFRILNLNYNDSEKIISNYSAKIYDIIVKSLKKEMKEKCMNRIKEEFIIMNSRYDNKLQFNFMVDEYAFDIEFEDYCKPKISKEINNLLLEKASLIFLEKSKKFFSEIISENVKDEEIDDLVNKNLDIILNKINEQ
jgi:hypothetical protein